MKLIHKKYQIGILGLILAAAFFVNTNAANIKLEGQLDLKDCDGVISARNIELPDGEKAFMLAIYDDQNRTPDELISRRFNGDSSKIDAKLFFSSEEFKVYNQDLNKILTNTGFLQLGNGDLDFTKYGVKPGNEITQIEQFRPLFLFSRTENFGKFCNLSMDDKFYFVAEKSPHFDILAVPPMKDVATSAANILELHNDEIFTFENTLQRVVGNNIVRVKFNKADQVRCISATGICALKDAKLRVQQADSSILPNSISSNLFTGQMDSVFATLNISQEGEYKFEVTNQDVNSDFVLIKGDQQIDRGENDVYKLGEGSYQLVYADQMDVDDLLEVVSFQVRLLDSSNQLSTEATVNRAELQLNFEPLGENLASLSVGFEQGLSPEFTFEEIKDELFFYSENNDENMVKFANTDFDPLEPLPLQLESSKKSLDDYAILPRVGRSILEASRIEMDLDQNHTPFTIELFDENMEASFETNQILQIKL